ncbi:probable membrane-associated kinase regulator 2 [Coffea eugenioides]|uniref:probable membrane-associated kinase regulator 2 n=1 Tax=Coffea eugenioides TaxID=49369 RepID=UPI000F60C819|nr:probable membrane-associated kinase regulator 2 [Coffea eugenioides]
MEPFSLLKFWRSAGTDLNSDLDSLSSNKKTNVDVRNRAPETDDQEESDEYDDISDNDDRDSQSDSFFDLVFTAPDCYNKQAIANDANCTLPHDSSKGDRHEGSIHSLIELESPLKSKVFPVDVVDPNSKPHSPISLLKSAPKFRVLLLGFRKSKSDKPQSNPASSEPKRRQFHKPAQNTNRESKRLAAVKYKVEQVPIGSLFSRDNSLRSKLQRERTFDFSIDDSSKPMPKDVPMYLKLIRPLYIRASKRYSDKMRFPWEHQSSRVSPMSSPAGESRRGVDRGGGGFRAVSKHLGRSRSAASSTAGMTASPANRRDDSLLLHNDGIQSAILHCKRSYNSPAKECSGELRLCQGKSTNLSSEQRNRCSSI